MTYHGNVEVGGPAEVRELAELMISKLAIGEMNNNAYLLRCRRTGAQVLIDAAAEPDRLLDLAGPSGLAGVVTTHLHRDHWTALAEVVKATGAATYASRIDAPNIAVRTDVTLVDGDTIPVGDCALLVRHIAGHTPGSIVLIYDDPDGAPHVFSADNLFPGGLGATWDNADNFASLYRDVSTKIFDVYPDETWVYPGHGVDTTLGAERPHLADWLARGS